MAKHNCTPVLITTRWTHHLQKHTRPLSHTKGLHCSDTSSEAGLLVWLVWWLHLNWMSLSHRLGLAGQSGWSDFSWYRAVIIFTCALTILSLVYEGWVTPESTSWRLLLSWLIILTGEIEFFIFLTYVIFTHWFSLISFRLFFDVFLHAVFGVILANALSSVLLGQCIFWLCRIISFCSFSL